MNISRADKIWAGIVVVMILLKIVFAWLDPHRIVIADPPMIISIATMTAEAGH